MKEFDYLPETDDGWQETAAELTDRQGIYGAIKRALIARGIPAEEIAFIHDFKTAKKKVEAFAACNDGRIRILIASTEKAGTGVNMQERLYAAHFLDPCWCPSDIEQRSGRILRQGNIFPAVHICIYITEGSFDAYSWQVLESKARFISQIMAGEVTARTAEDVDQLVLTAAQIKAIASGNPQILEKVATEVELTKLERLYSVWLRNRQRLQWEAEELPHQLQQLNEQLAWHEKALAQRAAYEARQQPFVMQLKAKWQNENYQPWTERARAGAQLRELAFALAREARRTGRVTMQVGTYFDFPVILKADGRGRDNLGWLEHDLELSLRLAEGSPAYVFNLTDSDAGVVQSADAALRGLEARLHQTQARHAQVRHRYEQVQAELGKGWEHAARYQTLQAQLQTLNARLTVAGYESADVPAVADLVADALQPAPEQVSLHQLASLSSALPVSSDQIAEPSEVEVKVELVQVEEPSTEPLKACTRETVERVILFTPPDAPTGKRQVKRKRVALAQLQFDFAES